MSRTQKIEKWIAFFALSQLNKKLFAVSRRKLSGELKNLSRCERNKSSMFDNRLNECKTMKKIHTYRERKSMVAQQEIPVLLVSPSELQVLESWLQSYVSDVQTRIPECVPFLSPFQERELPLELHFGRLLEHLVQKWVGWLPP